VKVSVSKVLEATNVPSTFNQAITQLVTRHNMSVLKRIAGVDTVCDYIGRE